MDRILRLIRSNFCRDDTVNGAENLLYYTSSLRNLTTGASLLEQTFRDTPWGEVLNLSDFPGFTQFPNSILIPTSNRIPERSKINFA